MKTILDQANPEEQLQRDGVTYEGWGQKLSLTQYLRRESVLRAHVWPQDQSVRMWLLKSERGEVLSSCETYPLVPGQVLGVGSVFTEVKWRGRGFATQLLQELTRWVGSKEAPFEHQASDAVILFSEVGERIYERAGFQGVDSHEWVFDLDETPNNPPFFETSLKVEPLSSHADLRARSSGLHVDESLFWIAPSDQHLMWHALRERIYAECLGRSQSTVIGARCADSFLIWSVDHKANALRVLDSSCTDGATQRALLIHAMDQARRAQVQGIRLWDCESQRAHFCHEQWGAPLRRVRREDSIAMIHFTSPRLSQKKWINIQRGLWI